MQATRAHWHELADRLPEFTEDEACASLGGLDDYYAHYQLPNRQQYTHRLGQLRVGDFRVVCQSWSPATPRGTLCLVHGLFDHTGVFRQIIDYALKANWRVCIFDLPGHGLSSGRQASIKTFDTYLEALDSAVMAFQQLYGDDLTALGQSTGGGILMRHCLRNAPGYFAKVVLVAPLLRAASWYGLIFSHGMLRWWTNRIKRSFSASSHDPVFVDFLANGDPLQSRYLYLDWVAAMFDAEADFYQLPPSEVDIHLIQGTDDSTVAWRYNIKAIPKKFPNMQVHMVEGAGHQFVNESKLFFDKLAAILDRIM